MCFETKLRLNLQNEISEAELTEAAADLNVEWWWDKTYKSVEEEIEVKQKVMLL